MINKYTFLRLLMIGIVTINAFATKASSVKKPLPISNPAIIASISCAQNGDWNDPNTWSPNLVPTINDDVTIGMGLTVTLSGTMNARSIMVMGTLKPTTLSTSFDLTTEGIMVHGGVFTVGTSAQAYTGNALITLTGNNPTQILFPDPTIDMGTKVIGVMGGGTLEFNGIAKKSWSQLNVNSIAGAPSITLKEIVDWSVGDKIVIASTDFDMNRAEVRVITEVSGATLTLDAPLDYNHFGTLQNYTHPKNANISWSLDERAEVGLLSHNIKIQGDSFTDVNGFGGHIMGMNGSQMRASYIELFKMGQKSKKGRYPWHWHRLANTGTGQFLKSSSIHNTFNRAVVVHSTNNTLVDNNVAYNNLGHAYFFEDGNEINNVMTNNLGLVTKRPVIGEQILPSDIKQERNQSGPSTFWISNPLNRINNNRAAGSDGSGIWFAPHQNVNSESYVAGYDPNKISLPLGYLDNNTTHSSHHGFMLGPTIRPNDANQDPNPNYDYMPGNPPTVNNITSFKNKLATYVRVGVNGITNYQNNFIIADNYKGDASTWDSYFDRFLWVGASQNFENTSYFSNANSVGGADGLVHLHTIYDGPVKVTNSYFAGVTQSNMSLFDQWGANVKFTGHTFRNTAVEPGSLQIRYRDLYNQPVWSNAVAYDIDGVLTGTPMSAISQDLQILIDEESSVIKRGYSGTKSPHRYAYVEVVPSDEIVGVQKRQRSVFRRSDGAVQYDNALEVEGVSMVPILGSKYTYTLQFEKELPYEVKIFYHSMNQGEYTIIGFPDAPLSAKVYLSGGATLIPQLSSLSTLKQSSVTSSAFEGNTLYVKFIAPSGANFESNKVLGLLRLCLYNNCVAGPNFAYKDTDGDGYDDTKEAFGSRNKNDASDMFFDFTSNTNGWVKSGTFGAECVGCSNSWLAYSNGTDPQIIKNGLNFNANSVVGIKALVKSQATGTFQLYWTTINEPSYSEDKSVSVSYNQANLQKDLQFNLEGNPKWNNNTITGLRLDPPSKMGHTWFWNVRANSCIQTQIAIKKAEINGWSYYGFNDIDGYQFGIEHKPNGIGANTNNFDASIAITNKNCDLASGDLFFKASSTTNATYASSSYWNITVPFKNINGWVNIRFFPNTVNNTSMLSAATTYATSNGIPFQSPLFYITTDYNISLPTVLRSDGKGFVDKITSRPISESGTFNNQNYVQLNNISTLNNTGGISFVNLSSKEIPVGSIKFNRDTSKFEGWDGDNWVSLN